MNPIPYQSQLRPPPPPSWSPVLPPNPPPSSTFWTNANLRHRLKELHDTVNLAKAMQKELEMLIKVKEAKGNGDNNASGETSVSEFLKFLERSRIDLEAQELVSVEAANALMSKLRALLEPIRVVTQESSPWEEKSSAVRLADRIRKSKRNKQWRKRKRKRVAEMAVKERENFEELDREADEWRIREIAKDIAQSKVEKMKEIAKQKAKEERKRLEAELELVLTVEKLQELRSIRIEKLKKQGHFLPEEDDRFLEKVRAAVEEEERQSQAAADTDAAKGAIATAEGSRKVTQSIRLDPKDHTGNSADKEMEDPITQSGSEMGSEATANKESGTQGSEGQLCSTNDYVSNLPLEFYHYYHGSNTDMGTLIEVRRTWDAYLRPRGSRIPGHWIQPPPPADEIWASYLLPPK
ncbi:hypothetical protein Nepgr_019118 [Nepenthes gracilis]|uniref:Programmed cell death protein 7 n=1 Tax=Nepenthes gracilis TaxID=150966 RepID=A0AAD3XTR7_NEPGR|nr:hypothetical protein Nepgr_019118 [Nepenthes gracilis]